MFRIRAGIFLILGMFVFGLLSIVNLPAQAACDPSYPTVCIAPSPPDLDCKDIEYRNFQVTGNDPHRFDGDHDGIGCEA
ncbi:MAG TPA: hypothetical protein V6C78_05525 [Crinalium sp.]|jgi:micrococcal nuclease